MLHRPNNTPRKFHERQAIGEVLSADNLNRAGDHVEDLERTIARIRSAGEPQILDSFTAELVSYNVAQEYDPTASQKTGPLYYAVRTIPKIEDVATGDVLTRTKWEEDKLYEKKDRLVLACNVSEYRSESHTLRERQSGTTPTGRIVRVYRVVYDRDDLRRAVHHLFWCDPPAPFMVKVEKDGGSDGTNATAATWTYTVRTIDYDGSNGELTELGTAVAVARPRPNGKMTFQTGSEGYGLAFYDLDTLKLWDAGEKPGTGVCT